MTTSQLSTKVAELQKSASDVHASCRVVFGRYQRTATHFQRSETDGVYDLLTRLLQCVESELTALTDCPDMSCRAVSVAGLEPDSIDLLSDICSVSGVTSMGEHLEKQVWRAALNEFDSNSPDTPFYAAHAARICTQFPELIADYFELITPDNQPHLSRISPLVTSYVTTQWQHHFGTVDTPASAEVLAERSVSYDQFFSADAFRYIDGTFYEVELDSVKDVEQFYGFGSIRDRFKNYFDDFAHGRKNQPLLISSLPGLGKTQFTVAYVKSHENLTLILPEPNALEHGLEQLIAQLAQRPKHRFVLFFDDIDTAQVDWFNFRTHVGGCFTLPENITIVVASNYEFPANISSRGIGLTYPMFDEVRCLEMIFDYLTDIGMKNPPNDLVSIIGADYVEEFGMRNFEDLSPRTLARYLETYDKSPEKRKRMLEMSRQKLVTKPDPQSFYDENIRLMKTLYGEEGLRKMREHVLGDNDL